MEITCIAQERRALIALMDEGPHALPKRRGRWLSTARRGGQTLMTRARNLVQDDSKRVAHGSDPSTGGPPPPTNFDLRACRSGWSPPWRKVSSLLHGGNTPQSMRLRASFMPPLPPPSAGSNPCLGRGPQGKAQGSDPLARGLKSSCSRSKTISTTTQKAQGSMSYSGGPPPPSDTAAPRLAPPSSPGLVVSSLVHLRDGTTLRPASKVSLKTSMGSSEGGTEPFQAYSRSARGPGKGFQGLGHEAETRRHRDPSSGRPLGRDLEGACRARHSSLGRRVASMIRRMRSVWSRNS